MERAAGVGGAGGVVTAVGQPCVDGSRRAGRRGGWQGRVVHMDRVEEGSR